MNRNIEEILKNLGGKDIPPDVEKIAEETSRNFSKTLTPSRQHILWENIMKARITKLAAAAVIIIAVLIGIHQLGGSVTTTAYAIEQTIEAMRSINSIHAYCTDWDNSQGEVWVQIDPETGQEEYYYADHDDLLIVGTPQATYYYYKDENRVRIRDEYVPASEVRISYFFEDLVRWVQQYHGELWFYFQYAEDLEREVIMVHGSIPAQGDMGEKEFVFRVDPQTKLPIDMEATKCGLGQGVKSVDSLEYNVPIPEGIFEFEVPDGAKVVYERKNKEGG
jgi:outer membrane lipoprotein-sorting protein